MLVVARKEKKEELDIDEKKRENNFIQNIQEYAC